MIEELRMARCDDCGAVENMPPVIVTEDDVSMYLVPKDWMAVLGNAEPKLTALIVNSYINELPPS